MSANSASRMSKAPHRSVALISSSLSFLWLRILQGIGEKRISMPRWFALSIRKYFSINFSYIFLKINEKVKHFFNVLISDVITGCNINVHKRCLDQVVIYNDNRKGSASSSSGSSSSSSSSSSGRSLFSIKLFRHKSSYYDNAAYQLQFCSANSVVEQMQKIDSFDLIKVLGKGGFGKFVLAKQKTTQKKCAVKIVRKSAIRKSELNYVLAEKRILAISIQHPFLVGMFSCFQSEVINTQLNTLIMKSFRSLTSITNMYVIF